VTVRSFTSWFLILLGLIMAGPYVLAVRPRTARDWIAIKVAIVFLIWILLGLELPIRSR
jgi:hypothetical protein